MGLWRALPAAAVGLLGILTATAAHPPASAAGAAHGRLSVGTYDTGAGGLPSPGGIARALATPPAAGVPPISVACGGRLPGTAHTIDCGYGRAARRAPRLVPPGSLVLSPTCAGRPTFTILFLHGQHASPVTSYLPFLALLLARGGPGLAGARLVFPVAPLAALVRQLPATPPGVVHQWFDTFPPSVAGVAALAANTTEAGAAARVREFPLPVDTLGAFLSTRRLEGVVAAEVGATSSGRVVVVGHSLGGAMALHLAARGEVPAVGGVLALSPFLPLAETLPAALARGPRPAVTVIHAANDETVPLPLGAGGARVLADAYAATARQGPPGVTFVLLPSGGHAEYLVAPEVQQQMLRVIAAAAAT